MPGKRKRRDFFESFAHRATQLTGSTGALVVAMAVVVAWAAVGPLFDYSDTWQLVINTGTTVVTFLMVFLIQRTQNKDSIALHLKLNELVAATPGASNRLINVEDLTEEDLVTLHRYYARLSSLAKQELDIRNTHSVEEAASRHELKHGAKPRRPGSGGSAE